MLRSRLLRARWHSYGVVDRSALPALLDAVPSLLYWIMGIWEAALIYGASKGTPYWNPPALLAGLLLLASPIATLTAEILFLSILCSYLRSRLNVTTSPPQA